ncbi:MAG: DUF885 domain-containing protein [Chloroflexi bacterium]|nr:DUF885 domain-containing protein [Chloroflexota bacterium]
MTDVATFTPSPVDELADRFWDGFLERNPLWATVLGDERFDDRFDDPSETGRAAELAALDVLEADIEAARHPDLGVEDRITLDILGVVADMRRQAHAHRLWQLESVDQMSGPQTLVTELARFQRVDTPERLERLLARLAAYPGYLRAHAVNIAEGVAAGRTASRVAVERTIAQVRRLLEDPAEASTLVVAHPELSDTDRARLTAAVETSVRPALAEFLAALETSLPSARSGEGLCWLPDGEALYGYAILASTTLPETAQALHDHGLARLDELDAERTEIAQRLGYPDAAAYRLFLEDDATNRTEDPAELVRLATEQVRRAFAAAPAWFGRLPSGDCEVMAVEPHQERDAPPAFYFPPAMDGSRPGRYYINTYEPTSRPLHRLAATTFHEATPGHHFQIALEAELPELNRFRRLGSRLAGMAYAEGWGLYAERLADEMGLYADDRERFGMLDSEAWRAARLVVDTGLHAFRWTRQQSIDLLRSRVGLSQVEAETETDRYITWPGQALAYMTGQREIQALRAQLEARDGVRFDRRAFHDQVIGHGSLPLATLRRELPGWVPAAE